MEIAVILGRTKPDYSMHCLLHQSIIRSVCPSLHISGSNGQITHVNSSVPIPWKSIDTTKYSSFKYSFNALSVVVLPYCLPLLITKYFLRSTYSLLSYLVSHPAVPCNAHPACTPPSVLKYRINTDPSLYNITALNQHSTITSKISCPLCLIHWSSFGFFLFLLKLIRYPCCWPLASRYSASWSYPFRS